MTRDAHDPRCERSTTKRCRCDCGGRLHGDQASQIDLEHAAQQTEIERMIGGPVQRLDDVHIHIPNRAVATP